MMPRVLFAMVLCGSATAMQLPQKPALQPRASLQSLSLHGGARALASDENLASLASGADFEYLKGPPYAYSAVGWPWTAARS